MTAGTDSYLDCLTMMEETLPDVLKSYIPTDIDLQRMAEEPEKYMAFMNYFVVADRSDINFSDEDRERLSTAEKKIDEIVKKNLILV